MAKPKAGLRLVSGVWCGSYITFKPHEMLPQYKTLVWTVLSAAGDPIGSVRWYTHWRKYCFHPALGSVFEEVCLGEIGQFLTDRTADHKNASKVTKKAP
jgi:hypothetical protein